MGQLCFIEKFNISDNSDYSLSLFLFSLCSKIAVMVFDIDAMWSWGMGSLPVTTSTMRVSLSLSQLYKLTGICPLAVDPQGSLCRPCWNLTAFVSCRLHR